MIAYANNTNVDVTTFHAIIIEAVANGGTFTEDFADIFTLTKTHEGSAVEYILDFA